MANQPEFEDMDSTGMFGHLIDQSSEKIKWNRETALQLLKEADWLEDLASKYRHLAGTLVMEAQDFSNHTADLITSEFPMEPFYAPERDPGVSDG